MFLVCEVCPYKLCQENQSRHCSFFFYYLITSLCPIMDTLNTKKNVEIKFIMLRMRSYVNCILILQQQKQNKI